MPAVDFGGVLTTDVWDSFADFCRERGLDPDAVKRLFRERPRGAGELLRGWRPASSTEADFERRFAELLGLSPEGLIDGLFAGLQPEPRR